MSNRHTHILTAAEFHAQGTSAFAVLSLARWHFNLDNKGTGHALRKIAHELAQLNGERLRTHQERKQAANDNRRPFKRRAA